MKGPSTDETKCEPPPPEDTFGQEGSARVHVPVHHSAAVTVVKAYLELRNHLLL